VILAALDMCLLVGADVTVGRGVGFVAVDARLPTFQMPCLVVRQPA
jgi:hypothetical protein